MRGADIRDLIAEQVARDLKFPETVVDKVISFQFREAGKAVKLYPEIEISGFGKFTISVPKVKRRIKHHEDIIAAIENKMASLPADQHAPYQVKLDNLRTELQFYYTRI